MSVVGINFGSATSGAGFDVTSTVNSILSNMRAPETAWATRTSALTAQDTALSTLGSDMSALSSALSSLTAFDGVLSQKQGATSDSSSIALTAADSTALAGSHTLTVQQLASASQQHTSKIPAGQTLAGELTLQVGSGPAQTIQVDSLTDKSVAGVAAAVNRLDAGVTASVITDSTGSYLAFTSTATGAANNLTIGTAGLSDTAGGSISVVTTQAGVDAQYTLDGIALSSGSNTVAAVLQGVTFQLVAPTTAPVTLQIANNSSGVTSALSSFVSAFNTLTSALSAQEGKDASGNALPLYGDQTVSLIQSQLSRALAFVTTNSGKSSNLAQLGISVGADGKLSLDTSTLSSALDSNFQGVASFFQTQGDFAQNLASVLNGLGTSGQGALALRTSQNSSEEKTLADDKTALEARIAQYQTSLTAELNTANQVLQGIPSQLNEVNQIYSAITGYKQA